MHVCYHNDNNNNNIIHVPCMSIQWSLIQTLTEGTKVTLTYELNRYTFRVFECKPAKGICVDDI